MDTVEVQTNPGAIDVLAFLDGMEYPTREVVLFTDTKAADEYVQLNRSDEASEGHDEKLSALEEKIQKSSLIVSLRGMAPGVVHELYAKDGTEIEKETRLIAASIVHVKNGRGEEAAMLDEAGVDKLRRYLKEGEFNKLTQGVVEVNFDASLFDTAADAGFLGGRTNPTT